MSNQNVSIEDLPAVVKRGLEEYCDFTADEVKQIVKEVSEKLYEVLYETEV